MHAPNQLATAMLRVSEIEGQRRRTTAARRSLAKELDEHCTGTGVCEPSWEFTPTVGSGRQYVHDDDGGVWEPVEFGIGELLCIVCIEGMGLLYWGLIAYGVAWLAGM